MSGFSHLKNLEASAGYAASKGIPMPKVSVVLTGLMMLLGGAGILLGIYVQCAILLLSVFLFVAAFKMHQYWAISDPMQRMGERINFYKNIGLLGAILMLLAIPLPWVMSLAN